METLAVETQRRTYADYRALDVDDNFLYELINGELVKKSAPSPLHQSLVRDFAFALQRFVVENRRGEVLFAPIDVFVDDESVPQPDVLFVREERRFIITNDGVMGAPDLVVEVILPSSVRSDRVDKMKLYRRLGVPEYWILDPNNRTVEIYALTNEGYDIVDFAVEKGELSSRVLSGFAINAKVLFGV